MAHSDEVKSQHFLKEMLAFDPFAMIHDHIGDDHVLGISFEGIEPFVSTGGFGHPIPRVLQALAKLMSKPWIVIDKENRNHIRHCKKRPAKIYKN